MRQVTPFDRFACRAAFLAALVLVVIPASSQAVLAASWHDIEPLKSRRADVERVLGKPFLEEPGKEGALHFNVAGGTVVVAFVDAKFVSNKKLSKDLEGTVLQIVLQHGNSSDTPESMGLSSKSDFKREDARSGTVYRNLKDGIVYTFIDNRLRTSRYSPSSKQFARAAKAR